MFPSRVPIRQDSTDTQFLRHAFTSCSVVWLLWIHKLRSTGCLEVLGAAECGNDVLRENQTDASKSISSLRRGFFGTQVSCWEINIMEKSQPVVHLMQAAVRGQILVSSHQPPSISRDVMMQVFCLRSSPRWLGTLSCEQFFKRAQFPL